MFRCPWPRPCTVRSPRARHGSTTPSPPGTSPTSPPFTGRAPPRGRRPRHRQHLAAMAAALSPTCRPGPSTPSSSSSPTPPRTSTAGSPRSPPRPCSSPVTRRSSRSPTAAPRLPLVALELAGRYVRRQGYRSAAVFVLDQATLPYETGRDSRRGRRSRPAVQRRRSGRGAGGPPCLRRRPLTTCRAWPRRSSTDSATTRTALVLGPGLDADSGPAGHTGRRLRARPGSRPPPP